MRLAVLLMLVILPICLAQSSYNKLPECEVSASRCHSFQADPDSKSITFSYKALNNHYSRSTLYDIQLKSVNLGGYDYKYYSYGQTTGRTFCTIGKFGISPDNLSNLPINIGLDQMIYVRLEGCQLSEDAWMKLSLSMEYTAKDQNRVQPSKVNEYAQINTFVESPGYQERQKMDRYVWRFMPLGALVLLGAIGFYRVRRC
jgi:hypothetical protein